MSKAAQDFALLRQKRGGRVAGGCLIPPIQNDPAKLRRRPYKPVREKRVVVTRHSEEEFKRVGTLPFPSILERRDPCSF